MKPIIFVWGTRPEAIKVAPVVRALRGLGVEPLLYCTGQHTTLLKGSPAEDELQDSKLIGLPPGQVAWEVWVRKAVPVIRTALRQVPDGLVCVQGDTSSAYAAALAVDSARRHQTYPKAHQLAHIEAGVRSGDVTDPWPEEQFRVQIDGLSDVHLCPTEVSKSNLLKEFEESVSVKHSVKQSVFVTGNPGVSALSQYARPTFFPEGDRTILVTLHRRELLRDPSLLDIVGAIVNHAQFLPDGWTVLWPLHPSLRTELGIDRVQVLSIPNRLQLCDPLPYREMIRALSRCSGVLTDSGGLTEDATTLGIPTAILRNHHDRPEACQSGSALLVGRTVAGVDAGFRALQGYWPRIPNPIFGTRDSAQQIATILADLTQEPTNTNPDQEGAPDRG